MIVYPHHTASVPVVSLSRLSSCSQIAAAPIKVIIYLQLVDLANWIPWERVRMWELTRFECHFGCSRLARCPLAGHFLEESAALATHSHRLNFYLFCAGIKFLSKYLTSNSPMKFDNLNVARAKLKLFLRCFFMVCNSKCKYTRLGDDVDDAELFN